MTWAARAGQELVTIEICRAWFSQGRNDELRLHEFEDADGNVDWRAINNNRQKIFRWLRGETTAARRKTQVLASVMKAVLPAERRARLESPGDPVLLATLAAKEGWKRLTLYISTSRQS
ncbi:toxin YdaT family protein [Escherichia coli]